jgi:hypothetical protein
VIETLETSGGAIPLPANVAQAIVVYTVAAHVASLPTRLPALGTALAGCVLAGLRWSLPPEYPANVRKNAVFLGTLFVLVWVWGIGNLVRGRQANMIALREASARPHRGAPRHRSPHRPRRAG